MDVLVGLFFLVMIVGLYFLPTLLAKEREVPNFGSIAAVNVFLGWTLVGWVVALAMALRTVPRSTPTGGDLITGQNATAAVASVRGSMKRCPDCAELVQLDARICRYCHFNFDTGIGADGQARTIEAPIVEEATQPPRPLAMAQAWSQLEAGQTKIALDQAFVALQNADPAVLADLAAFASTVMERDPRGNNRMRAGVLTQRVDQEQAKTQGGSSAWTWWSR